MVKKIKNIGERKLLEATKLEEWNNLHSFGQKMIELDSQDFDGWATKGDAQYHLGNFDLALTFYKKAIQINNKDVLSWQNFGHTFKSLGKYRECYQML